MAATHSIEREKVNYIGKVYGGGKNLNSGFLKGREEQDSTGKAWETFCCGAEKDLHLDRSLR